MWKAVWLGAGLVMLALSSSARAEDFLFDAGLANTSSAQSILNNDLSGSPYFASSKENILYGPQGESGFSTWHLAQWGINEDLPDSTDCLGDCSDGTWQTTNQYGSLLIVRNRGHYMWQMSHTKVPSEYPCVHEVDMFAETTNGGDNTTYPGGDYPGYPDALVHAQLSTLSSLTLETTQRVVSASQRAF